MRLAIGFSNAMSRRQNPTKYGCKNKMDSTFATCWEIKAYRAYTFSDDMMVYLERAKKYFPQLPSFILLLPFSKLYGNVTKLKIRLSELSQMHFCAIIQLFFKVKKQLYQPQKSQAKDEATIFPLLQGLGFKAYSIVINQLLDSQKNQKQNST